MRRMITLLGGALVLVGCAAPGVPGAVAPDPGEDGTPSATATSSEAGDPNADPADLVGLWRVVAGDVPEDTWLRLDAGSYQLWGLCEGFLEGGWSASPRVLVASVPSSVVHESCIDHLGQNDGVAWLTSAVSYRVDGDERRLLDADGSMTATLRVDGAPEPIALAADFYTEAPELDEDQRELLRAEPPAVPDGLVPASGSELVGRWVPADPTPTDPHVELSADGTWTGSDGCNTNGGAWATDDGGRILATGGPQTQIGCDGAPVPGWWAKAARAGFDGSVLVLLDRHGTELGRLVRA